MDEDEPRDEKPLNGELGKNAVICFCDMDEGDVEGGERGKNNEKKNVTVDRKGGDLLSQRVAYPTKIW